MSYIIDVTTENLKEMKVQSMNAVHLIDEAIAKLNKNRSHNDWTCREKRTIDANAADCMKDARRIKEDVERFGNAINRSVDKYVDAEKRTISGCNFIDNIIGGIIRVVTNAVNSINAAVSGIVTGIKDWFGKQAQSINKIKGYTVETIIAPINIVNFKDIFKF